MEPKSPYVGNTDSNAPEDPVRTEGYFLRVLRNPVLWLLTGLALGLALAAIAPRPAELYIFLTNQWVRYISYSIGVLAATIATLLASNFGKRVPQPGVVAFVLVVFVAWGAFVSFPVEPPAGYHTSLLYDITEDDEVILPGASFQKGWRMHTNSGLPEGIELRRVFGTEGPRTVRLEAQAVGADYDLYTTPRTAPNEPGCYRSEYRFFAPGSPPDLTNYIPHTDKIFLQIRVAPEGQENDYDYGVFVDDLNIRDDTLMEFRQQFTKEWSLHNCGDNTWESYKAKLVRGDFGPPEIALPIVPPHQDFILRAEMVAPAEKGTKEAVYVLQAPDGQEFGDEFRVVINVVQNAP